MSNFPDITISAADLWPGATAEHANQVVQQLQRERYRAFSVSTPSDATIRHYLTVANAFWTAMMEAAETAVSEAASQQNAEALRVHQRAQETHRLIMQQRDEAQAALESAAARLQELGAVNGRLLELGETITRLQGAS